MSHNDIKSLMLEADSRRKANAIKLLRRLGVFVLLPTVIACIYYAFIATTFYESESQFIVQSGTRRVPISDFSAQAYILSREALTRLDSEQQFIASYKSHKLDVLNRLSADADFETIYRYYLDLITISFDPVGCVFTFKVKSHDPVKAQVYSKVLLKYADEAVFKISEKFKLDQLSGAKQDLKLAEKRFVNAKTALIHVKQKDAIKDADIIEKAIMERRFAEDGYRFALDFLESSSKELLKYSHSLAVIVEPDIPEVAAYPKVLVRTGGVFGVLLGLFGILYLLIAAVKEHLGI